MGVFKRLIKVKFKINLLLLILIPLYFYLGHGVEIAVCLISILLHELSHILLCIKYELEIKELELFPFGSVARSDKSIWFKPNQEIIIAAAGPVVSLLISLFFFLISGLGYQNYIISILIKANFIIGMFNLLPFLPLDGGRITRAFLSKFIGFKPATRRLIMLTYISTILAVIVGSVIFIKYSYGLYIVLISIFLFLAARKESKMVAFIFMYDIIGKKAEVVKQKVMETHLLVALRTVTAMEITKYFLPQKYHIIIVIDNNCNCMGKIYENDLVNGIVQYGIYITLEELLITKEK